MARLERGSDPNALVAYRDGLLIVFFALCGRRLRSVSLLQVGGFRVEFSPAQTKTKRRDRFGLHVGFTPWMRHYLDVIRPALLAGRRQEALWISAQGGPLTTHGISSRIQRLSRERFGISFGPHRIRHSIVTTVALRLGAPPVLAAALVGNTPAVAEKSYNHAGSCHAAALCILRGCCNFGKPGKRDIHAAEDRPLARLVRAPGPCRAGSGAAGGRSRAARRAACRSAQPRSGLGVDRHHPHARATSASGSAATPISCAAVPTARKPAPNVSAGRMWRRRSGCWRKQGIAGRRWS
ncbi:hypothetical protein MVG78_19985 (plasmid) [Roseomonas gilardii subsp. gilardii]|uniref:hypothetical protein n=1 Tax=Roseomonas gilardii TaxID=257708 RepID=UPI001FFB635C|nr:hypothetical protein [Roseomonas gilardii]UPG74724.1 hypothetical protein MVG78_19985 [Roseomonas gilardii subsp. gilardii]